MKLLTLCLSMIADREEQQKFEQLYWEYNEQLFYCAMRKVHDLHRAEDVVNTVFLHIAQNMHMVKEVISPSTKRLLMTMVERTAINMYNKYQKEYNRTVQIHEANVDLLGSYSEDEKILAQAILDLPLQYRQAIVLKYSQGYNNREIAAILDCSVAKVEKLISRGKKKLFKLLEEE